MIINTNLKNFKKKQIKKNNQIIYHSEKFKNKFIIENLIDNFFKEKNSFVFESVDAFFSCSIACSPSYLCFPTCREPLQFHHLFQSHVRLQSHQIVRR